jgi:hypothetical protein
MDTSSTKMLLDFVLQTLIIVITPIAIMLAHKLTREFAKRTGVTVAEQQALQLDDAIMKGIAFAHEQGRKALKLNLPAVASIDKRATAIDFVVRTLKEQKMPEKTREYIGGLIEARLNLDRSFTETGKS